MKNKVRKIDILKAAEKWVFETNGHRWSNNDATAGDNFGSFLAGAKFALELAGAKIIEPIQEELDEL